MFSEVTYVLLVGLNKLKKQNQINMRDNNAKIVLLG